MARTRPTEQVKTLQRKTKILFIKLIKYNIQSAKTHFQHTGFKSNCNKRCEVLENGWNFAMYLLYHSKQVLTSPRSKNTYTKPAARTCLTQMKSYLQTQAKLSENSALRPSPILAQQPQKLHASF